MMALRERLAIGRHLGRRQPRVPRLRRLSVASRRVRQLARKAGELGLAVPDRFEDWRDEKTERVWKRGFARSTPSPPLASCLRPRSPKKACRSAPFAGPKTKPPTRSFAGSTACCRVCASPNFCAEVQGWTGFADRFAHLRTGAPPDDSRVLMTALLADATNLGLTRMARSSGAFSHSQLLWVAEWHVRDETYQAALACLVDAIHAQPFTKVWGDGDTSSSDGQFFRAGGHGEARADYNAKYGSEPGVKFYTHVSDRYAPFHSKVIAANASEAAHVLDGLMHHESSIDIREHYTDTAGAIDHVFGLCHLLGFRFAPRIRDLADRRLYVVGARAGLQSARSPDRRRRSTFASSARTGTKSCAWRLRSRQEPSRLRRSCAASRPIPDRMRSPRRSRKSADWSARCSRSTGSATLPCAGGPTPASTRAKRATRSPGPCSSTASAKSAIGPSRTSATAPPASISPSRPSSSGTPSISAAPSMSCARAAKSFPTSFSPTSRRSAGSTSPSTAITSGPLRRSEMPSGPYETRAPNSLTRLSVGFREECTMTPKGALFKSDSHANVSISTRLALPPCIDRAVERRQATETAR